MYNGRRRYYNRSLKYSNETIAFNTQVTQPIVGGASWPAVNPGIQDYNGVMIVPPTNVLGNRKVKNFTLKVSAQYNDDFIFGVLVYVPEGTLASSLTCAGSNQSLYEPNQNVIASFMIPPCCERDAQGAVTVIDTSTTLTVSNKLARNLSTGDSIVLFLSCPNGITAGDGTQGVMPCNVSGTVNYAIRY